MTWSKNFYGVFSPLLLNTELLMLMLGNGPSGDFTKLGGFGVVYSHLKRLTLRLLIHIGSSSSNEWSEASCSSTQALRTVSLFREVQVYSDLVWGCL